MALVILGGGESGTGAAILAKQKGLDVFLSDAGSIAEKYKNQLIAHKIPFEEQGHQFNIDTTSEVIKSPGIPQSAAVITKLRAANIRIIDEIEFATRYMKTSKILAVTGTNGKSTTVSLIYHLLRAAGLSVGLAGNVGNSIAKLVAENQYDYYVLEVSYAQLACMQEFKPHIACISNITADHLDLCGNKMELYAAIKFSILRNMTASDHFIYNMDDPITQAYVQQNKIIPTVHRVTRNSANDAPIFVSESCIHSTVNGQCYSFPKNLLNIPGDHNEYNAMAAVTAALLTGVPVASISDALHTFTGLSHRIEWCGAPRGINCIDDSKATNIASTAVALNHFKQPIVWIVGGKDKCNDYTELLPIVKKKVQTIVCLGVDNTKIVQAFAHLGINIRETNNMTSAVDTALTLASPESTVLLSPACASFDLFKNAEDRGNQFRERVEELIKNS